jgi:hypothetical protein
MRHSPIKLLCAFCKESFTRPLSKLKNSKSKIYFCSRHCKDEAQKIKNKFTDIHPSHYGTGSCKETYRRIALENLPHKCNRCGYNKLLGVLAVHHKDRDKSNNLVSNLEILCHNCHAEEHILND